MTHVVVISVPVELWDTSRNALAAAGVRLDKVEIGPGQAPRYLATDIHPGASRLGLTDREMQALRGVAAGCTSDEIGRGLGVTADTVKTHLRKVYRKLCARDRAHAVALAYESGVLGGGAR